MEYWKAEGIQSIIKQYLKYHPDLAGATIGCIFREKAMKSSGRQVVGKVRTVSDRWKPLLQKNYDFVIEIGEDAWADLYQDQKEAWIDYLLQQCYGEQDEDSGEITWKTRDPSIRVFPETIERHGVDWDPAVEELKRLDIGDGGSSSPNVGSAGTESSSSRSDEGDEETASNGGNASASSTASGSSASASNAGGTSTQATPDNIDSDVGDDNYDDLVNDLDI